MSTVVYTAQFATASEQFRAPHCSTRSCGGGRGGGAELAKGSKWVEEKNWKR